MRGIFTGISGISQNKQLLETHIKKLLPICFRTVEFNQVKENQNRIQETRSYEPEGHKNRTGLYRNDNFSS